MSEISLEFRKQFNKAVESKDTDAVKKFIDGVSNLDELLYIKNTITVAEMFFKNYQVEGSQAACGPVQDDLEYCEKRIKEVMEERMGKISKGIRAAKDAINLYL